MKTLLFRTPVGIPTAVYTDANDTDGAVSYSIAFSGTAGNAGSAVTRKGSVTTDNNGVTSAMSIFFNNSTTLYCWG